jgi:hypothetical protein
MEFDSAIDPYMFILRLVLESKTLHSAVGFKGRFLLCGGCCRDSFCDSAAVLAVFC